MKERRSAAETSLPKRSFDGAPSDLVWATRRFSLQLIQPDLRHELGPLRFQFVAIALGN